MEPDLLALRLATIGALLLVSAFLSGSETSIFSLSSQTVQRLASASRAGRLIAELRKSPRGLLITILLGNVAVNVLAATTMSETLRQYMGPGREDLAAVISLVTMSLLVLLIGEVTPKTLAVTLKESLALRVVSILYIWHLAITPVRLAFLWVTDRVLALFGSRTVEARLSKEEMQTAIRMGHLSGELDTVERDMLHGLLEVRTKPVGLLMRPRTEMVTFPVDARHEDIRTTFRREEISRLPIWENTEERIIGILHVRDFLVHQQSLKSPDDLRGILSEPLFVPESKLAADLLQEFRQGETHLAIVVDEYGGVAGLATIEDIIEEIVGDIWDRGDLFGHCHPINGNRVRVSGRMSLDELRRRFNVEMEAEGIATVGGYVVDWLGRIPVPGEVFEVIGLRFEVLAADPNRVRELIVEKVVQSDSSEAAG